MNRTLPRTMLALEREPLIIAWMREVLEEAGWQLHACADLAGVLKSVRARQPTAVSIDVTTPGLGGEHIINILKNTFPRLPLVAVARFRSPGTYAISRSYDLPILLKPFAADELFSALRRCGGMDVTLLPPTIQHAHEAHG